MPNITFSKNQVPFLLNGSGKLNLEVGAIRLDQPIDESAPPLVAAQFDAGGSSRIQLGSAGSVKLGVTASAHFDVVPVFKTTATGPGPKILEDNGLGDYFAGGAAHAGQLILALDTGGSAGLTAAGSFTYAPLTASFEVDAGANGGYAYLRAFDKTRQAGAILAEFAENMRLPDQGVRAPEPGEAIALSYGGYLKLSAEVSAGYKLAGTKSISIADMALSEKYDLSILGKISLTAGVAGQYSILVTADDELPDWARVRVHRHRSSDLKVAADVNVVCVNTLDGLPGDANEFLGAVLGVNAKSFLTVFQKALELSDIDKLEAELDGLATGFIGEYVGKAFDALDQTGFGDFLRLARKAVDSYQHLGDAAVTLYDKFLGRLDILHAFLERITNVEQDALATLRKDLSPEFWTVLSQLTGGDLLGFLVAHAAGLAEVKGRAQKVLELLDPAAPHDEIRKLVNLAKAQFGLDGFFNELAKFDSVDKLKAVANGKAGAFVSRLVGRALRSNSDIKKAVDEVHGVLGKLDDFKNKLYQGLCDVANSSWKVALHAEYSRASSADALIDVSINMGAANGPALLALAGKADFTSIIANTDVQLVRVRSGVFTHRTRRESAFSVHITGWHLNYSYEGFDRVITDTEQRLRPTPHGLMLDSTVTLETERERRRRDESMHVHFLLRAVGESSKLVASKESNLAYFIETLKSLTASYQLDFTDANTSGGELSDYLAFAKSVGLDRQGATLDELLPFLPKAVDGTFGDVRTSYDVRFGEQSVQALLTVKSLSEEAEQAIREKMRLNLLANYLKTDGLHDVAFAYATQQVFDTFMSEGFATFMNTTSSREFPVEVDIDLDITPSKVTLDKTELQTLTTIFFIENSMIDAIRSLCNLIGAGTAMDPREFERKLAKFGDAMNKYDAFDQSSGKHGAGTDSVFILFDTLLQLASQGGAPANIASLSLTSKVGTKTFEKIFLSDEAVHADPPPVGALTA